MCLYIWRSKQYAHISRSIMDDLHPGRLITHGRAGVAFSRQAFGSWLDNTMIIRLSTLITSHMCALHCACKRSFQHTAHRFGTEA